jgi:hypothetical protein
MTEFRPPRKEKNSAKASDVQDKSNIPPFFQSLIEKFTGDFETAREFYLGWIRQNYAERAAP